MGIRLAFASISDFARDERDRVSMAGASNAPNDLKECDGISVLLAGVFCQRIVDHFCPNYFYIPASARSDETGLASDQN
jgi:hypothetical protein